MRCCGATSTRLIAMLRVKVEGKSSDYVVTCLLWVLQMKLPNYMIGI